MKPRHISAALALAIFLPLAASALTADDIQAQIQSLLAQLAQLQEQLKQLQMPAPVTPPVSRICPILNRTLARGASGSDVTSLQAYLGVSQTGYFGPLTEQAVQQLQVQEGVVSSGSAATTGYGSVGARTRAVFARRCGTVVSPPQPQPPIACTAVYPICGVGYHVGGYCNNQCLPDTTSAGAPTISGLDAPTSLNVGQTGTWTSEAGTYSPTFTVSNAAGSARTSATVVIQGVKTCNPVPIIDCAPGYTYTGESYDSARCKVAGKCVPNPSQSFSASPTSGVAPLTVSFSATGSAETVRYVDFGDGTMSSLQYQCVGGGYGNAGCSLIASPHTYASAGTYIAKLQKPAPSCQTCTDLEGRETIGTVTITVTGAQTATLSASPTSGPAPLAVIFKTSVTSGIIDFGEGTSGGEIYAFSCGDYAAPESCGYGATHTYTKAGVYIAKYPKIFDCIGSCDIKQQAVTITVR
ncbi:MAG: Peptidoglycan-binding domain 1 protein [Candidatus Kaiserbacteria bacterium GW2011_GWA2_52_12]|uniref:Peptidoglycan-binding domain 1 protein n=1 Tax=Candidatus Kaiserbacteria bacterium GW2011_GWA2_52_12 TaxID=1618671 RepID=A0A0G1WWM1_9BACT|nr:MAG: Peptidoglycan-binding domain 1 protein [Candidatus Kaiserbacteria bacterium GW2011_GWA2_52_12]